MAIKVIPQNKAIEEIVPQSVAEKLQSLTADYNILVEYSKRREVALGQHPYSFKRVVICPKEEDPLLFIEKASARLPCNGELRGLSIVERDFHPVKTSLMIFNGDPQEYKIIIGANITELLEKGINALKS